MLKVLELFAGIGACSKALERLGIEHEIVDAVEIDKYAIKSFNAVHGTNFEPQDITKWDKDIEVDLIMHGSPCQDFSVAGKGAGGDKGSGTRSSLMYETLRIVEKPKPQYVIWENVKNLLSKKHRHNFDAYLEAMEGLGYANYYKVLNAKDYGVPQNRERVFTVSIKNQHDVKISADGNWIDYFEWSVPFEFPAPMPLTKKLADVLEDEVDEKYYLSDEQVASFKASTAEALASKINNNAIHQQDLVQTEYGICRTIPAGTHGSTPHLLKTIVGSTKAVQSANGQLHSGVVGRVEAINGHDILKRVYGTDGVSPTLSTMGGGNTEPKILTNDSDKDGE